MTTTRLERLTRQALGTHTSASPDPAEKASYAAPALLITAVAAVLLLSGCALSPERTDAANLGQTTSGLGQTPGLGTMWFTGP